MTDEERKAWDVFVNDIRNFGDADVCVVDSAILAADARIRQLEEAVRWALLELNGQGIQRKGDEIAYELRKRAGMEGRR